MAYEISVGPPLLTINSGECVLITDTDGAVVPPTERGLFFRDMRLLSRWTVTVDHRPWQLLSSASVSHFAAQAVMTNPELPCDGTAIPAGSVSLTLSRLIGGGGVRETLRLRNHNRMPLRLLLAIRSECDAADIFDVKSHRLVERGETVSTWSPAEGRLETVHTNGAFRRGLAIEAAPGAPPPYLRDGALAWSVALAPQADWTATLLYRVVDGDERHAAPDAAFAARAGSAEAAALRAWKAQALRLHTPHDGLRLLYEQSVDDLAALRLPIDCGHEATFVPAAGIPWFIALFGRDSLITAIQTVPVYPDFARGALTVLASHQADALDDDRDMQPGKIPHELRRGELSELGLGLYRPYYGTADATPLYLILLHEAWRFTGDRTLIEQHRDTAERCLDWIDQHGDMDGDGFQEYARRTPAGAENQAWKDSGNAVLYEDGDDVPAPKALCELQGYVFDAWVRSAAIFEALGEPARAATLRSKADTLHERFNAAFWNEADGFYALCLDPAKRPVMSVASNPGHLLWSGIVPPERAERVVHRLMTPDMWSGWGVRTFSAAHPAYNPHDYQLGAVWPHDNGLIALGLARYGFRNEAARIAAGLIDAADRFLLHRLPEVFSGVGRDECPFPVQYLGANVPQAWAAGTVFCLLRALLNAEADGAASTLTLDPQLPAWLPELSLEQLAVGPHRIDLRVWREGGTTRAAITRGNGVRLVTP